MRIKLNGEKINTSPDNTCLYQYTGELSMYNMVYIDGQENFARVFETSKNGELYKALAKEAIEGKYPTHQNLTGVFEDDRKAYEELAVGDVRKMPNHVPIEWQKAH